MIWFILQIVTTTIKYIKIDLCSIDILKVYFITITSFRNPWQLGHIFYETFFFLVLCVVSTKNMTLELADMYMLALSAKSNNSFLYITKCNKCFCQIIRPRTMMAPLFSLLASVLQNISNVINCTCKILSNLFVS